MAVGEVPLVSLDDSFQTFTGKTPPKSRKDLFGNDYPFYKPGDFDDGLSVSSAEDGLTEDGLVLSKVVAEGATMVVCIGASIGKVGYVESKGSCNQQINVIPVSEQFNPRFVFIYCCSSWFKKQIEAKANYSSMPILSLRQFGKLVIPMPPLSVQQQVVDILDRFDALTTSLTDGLPAEIEARRQQYEYYRDKLLDFPRKGAAA